MRRVYKFPLVTKDAAYEMGVTIPVGLSRGFKPLRVEMQDGDFYLWAEVDPDAPRIVVEVYLIPTGFEIPKGADYLNTVFEDDRPFVWHFYVSRFYS